MRQSYSSLSTYKECPAKYSYRYKEKLPSEPSAAMKRGTRLHKLAEDYLAGGMCPYDLKRIGLKIFQMRDRGAVSEQTWLLDSDWHPTQDINEAALKAVIDVHYLDHDVLHIHDYKSGQEYPGHQDQLELYSLVGLQRYPLAKRVEASAIYIDSGNESSPRSIIRGMYPRLRERWVDLIGRVEGDREFLPTPGRHCKRCNFSGGNGGPCRAG
jgi:CRISPR/Cas system-associated exonuclease Cas4 (RecB family)